jgi:alanyl-tRNA synthetase
MTERLYYNDCYLREFEARVVERADEGRRIYLDRTAFYPASGGQPFDLGTLGGVAVKEIVDEQERVAHLLEAPLAGTQVRGQIDWPRRFDHMQQHTGQHLLSAVLVELYGIRTVSFHMGAASSTIDVEAPALESKQWERVEERCAEIVGEARPVTIAYEDSSADLGLRKPAARAGTLRIVSIEALDRSACGGTHLRSTAEIGPILLRKQEKIRGNTRLEFVCGRRALRQARRDFGTLAEISRIVSAPFDETPALIQAQMDKARTLEKNLARALTDLARREGRELYEATAPDASGLRRATQRGAIDEAMRARAQAFAGGAKAVFLAISENPPAVLLAASPDSGVNAGERVKRAVSAAGGRGGGNAVLAQGSVPPASLEAVIAELS